MFSKLLKRKPQVRAPENPSVPDGTIVWAIGDIHGRLDLLVPLVEAIMADAAASAAERKVVIFLGDYIDRGPESRGVIEYLTTLPISRGVEWRFLKGNHEETMLRFLEDPAIGSRWCEYGGDAALESYGLRAPYLKHRADVWGPVAADLAHRIPASHLEWLESLELCVTLGDYCFVHAGLRPGLAISEQSEADMLWIRDSFLQSQEAFEKVVVHGHTPTKAVYSDHRRIGVDTKAYASDVLTALRLERDGKSLMRTCAGRVSKVEFPQTA